MENNKWDRDEWQGRRKDQVDSTNVITWSVMAIIAFTVFMLALKYAADHAQYFIK